MHQPSRRAVLASLTAAAVGLAGCSGTDSDGTTPPVSETTRTRPPSPTPRTTARPDTTTATSEPPETTADPADGLPKTGPPTAGVEAFDERLPPLLREWGVPGASVSVSSGGRLVFTRGYGYADAETESPVRPASLFRVASISKPITAVATLDLVERGRLSLSDRAFDVREDLLPADGPADERVREITVGQLLRHTAGFDARQLGYDPGFRAVETAREEGETPPASPAAKIRNRLRHDLGFEPGARFRYSNVGYLVLGRVLEGVTETEYERHVREGILRDVGATRAQVGATRRENLADGEVRYHGNRRVESVFPDAGEVPAPYGRVAMGTVDAFGGWVASTVDLLRLFGGVDGRANRPDVLAPEARATMTERPPVEDWSGASQYYGMGWFVIPGDGSRPGLWHNGSLPGTYGFAIREPNADRTLAALFNARPEQRSQFNVAAQRTLRRALRSVPSWPDRDLFDEFP